MPTNNSQTRLSSGAASSNKLSENTGKLGSGLANLFLTGGGLGAGFDTATDILKSKGGVDPADENARRREIERQRQTGQQNLDQQGARSGLGGSAGFAAVKGALEGSAGAQQADLTGKLFQEREERKRSDLQSVLGNLFLNPATSLVTGEQARLNTLAGKPKGPSDLEKGLGFVSGLFCWVARRVLQDDRWMVAREYILDNANAEEIQAYADHGEALARDLTDDEARELTPMFEAMVKEQTDAR
jgi:hypothetical protein